MRKSFARIGKLKTSSGATQTAVKMSTDALTVMGGKSSSIILAITKLILASNMGSARSTIAHIITQKWTVVSL